MSEDNKNKTPLSPAEPEKPQTPEEGERHNTKAGRIKSGLAARAAEKKAAGKKRKKRKFSLRKLIYTDKYLIITSLFLAVVVWVITSMNVSPQTEKTIPVTVTVSTNSEAQQQLGIESYGEQEITVQVTVSAQRYIVRDITADDLSVSVDTSSVLQAGYHTVPITASAANERNDFTITKFSPTSYEAYFDVESEQSYPIEINYTNPDFVADGYMLGQVQMSDTTALVRGAANYMRNVSHVVADVTFENKLTETQNVNLVLRAVDENGEPVDFVNVSTENSNPNVVIPILKRATLPVRVGLTNTPEGLNTSDIQIRYSVSQMEVGMLESALESTTSILLGDIDFSRLNIGENEFSFDPNSVNGVTPVSQTDPIVVTVTVPEDYESKYVSLTTSGIKITGVPEGYRATVQSLSASRVRVISPNSVDDCNISLAVDLGYTSADTPSDDRLTQTASVTFTVTGGQAAWAYGTVNATVLLEKE